MLTKYLWIYRAEIEAYSALDPAVRVVILKALCDIRVEVFQILIFFTIIPVICFVLTLVPSSLGLSMILEG